jgi:hypothetical protein
VRYLNPALSRAPSPKPSPLSLAASDWLAKVGEAATEDELRTTSREGSKAFTQAKDVPGYAAFMKAVAEARRRTQGRPAMREILFRCSSIGKLMTEPKTQKEGPLSVGAKTYIRELAAQEIFGVEFEVSSKHMEKGILVEPESIALLNRVRGLSLEKNTERRAMTSSPASATCSTPSARRGHDLKSSWSIATFPICTTDCEDKLYEWQMRGYMALWDADEWEVNYALVDTPEHLIGYEPMQLHVVSHIPEHMRLTTWTVKRDAGEGSRRSTRRSSTPARTTTR